MKDFLSHLHEQDAQELSEAKRKRGGDTKGHAFQREMLSLLQSSLPPSKREKITFTTAGFGSNSADIRVVHADYPNQPLLIECKDGVSLGGALTWNYDGSEWSISPNSRNAPAICGTDPVFCANLKDILGTPTIMNRVHKVIARHAHFIPELMTNKVSFTTATEVWKMVLKQVANEIQAESYDDDSIKWKFPVEGNRYWKTLNSMMHGNHMLAVKGMGTLLVGGASFPESWFMPTPTLLSAPRIDMVTADAGGMAEARFKKSGKEKTTVVQHNRSMFIKTGTNTKHGTPPQERDAIKVVNLEKALGFDPKTAPQFGLRGGSTAQVRYIVHSGGDGDSEHIGHILKIHSIVKASMTTGTGPQHGYAIVCDFVHSARSVTFETNLRLNDIKVPTPVNFEVKPSIFANCIV